ncbi:MAG TPA: alpha/beta hydrolase [Acidimicrobiales bacterium]|jgi:pimeloyl-ACP methyl ester carboxylesterase|nr:alpha/beta hydrolase [Acidimicrobiales bacterium]
MPHATANGITIEYDEFGSPEDPALLLIMGLGTQMIAWDEAFCRQLAAEGFRVVRFDNRDVGLSQKIEDGPRPDVLAAMQGDTSSAAYTLDDMAADAGGLLDALGIDAAHIVGASMGGMIAQTFAINYPERTLSLCSIMSTTGAPTAGQPHPEIIPILLGPRPAGREDAMDRAEAAVRAFGSRGLPVDWAAVRERAGQSYDRCFYPIGFARQLVAIIASGDRTERLRQLDVPTVVIHGTDDKLIDPSGGEATAAAIPGAEHIVIEGMGHDLPAPAWPAIVGAIVRNTARAGVAR